MQIRTIGTSTILILALGIAWLDHATAKGPPIKVEQAIPGEAEQGQQNLPVKIKGRNFGPDDTVHFLVAGTDDESQIEVVSQVYDDTTGDLDTLINVSDAALLSNYDIEVRRSSGRGKGTDLFKVLEKGNDSGSGSGHSELSAKFCLGLENQNPGLAPYPVSQDLYCDSNKDKVQIATGSGPGFRFDTNTSQKSPNRWLQINVPGGSVDIYNDFFNYLGTLTSGEYDINLRFNKTDQDGGLDLGAMAPGDIDYVPIDMSFVDPDGQRQFGLAWGETSKPFSHGDLGDNPCIANYGLDAQVERLLDGASWRIRSNPDDENAYACLWIDNNESLENQQGTPVSMPFDFTIVIK